MEPSLVWAAAFVLLFAGASFFFALAETALFSLSRWQVNQLSGRKPAAAGIVRQLLAQPQELLATMALGNTFALAGLLGVSLLTALAGHWPLIAAVLGLTLVLGEVLPKTLAVRRPERWALRVARPLRWFQSASRPLHQAAQRINAALLNAVVPAPVKQSPARAEAEYQELLEMAFQQGALAKTERDIILQIISLDRRTVKEVMRPRAQMDAISDDCPVEEMVAAARRFRHRRLPIYDETLDTIVGVLNTRALLLNPEADFSEAMEVPSFVPETMNLLQLFKALQRQQRGLAIVLDEFGGTAGVVTMEDILAEVVGGLRPERPGQSAILETLGPGRWRVSGTLRLDDFRREYSALGDVPEVETMGGLLTKLLDVVPAPGESATFRGLKLTAHQADERRVRELLVEVVK